MPHSPELQSQVRALAHLLAAGRISWAEYRERRTEIVDAIARGDEALRYSPAEIFEDITSPKDQEFSQVFIDLGEVDAPPKRWPAVVGVAALVIAVGVAGWAVWRSAQPPAVATTSIVERTPAETLLDTLVSNGTWEPAELEETESAWRHLSADDREAARRTAAWRRLQQALREEINRERVLASVDESGGAAARLARLERFQQSLSE